MRHKHSYLLVTLLALLAAGRFTAVAETVTYTISGNTDGQGNVELVVTASGGATGTASTSWAYATATSASVSLPGSINLGFGSDKTGSMAVQSDVLQIEALSSTGGYITLSHGSKYVYHITLKNSSGSVIQDAWNMTKSYTYRFQSTGVRTIVVEYATAIPITDAVISGINNSYPVSNAAVTPVPTVTWHNTTLTKDTDYYLSYQNNTTAGTATVRATGKGIFSNSTNVSANYTLYWATYAVRFNKNSDSASGSMSDQPFYYTEEKALTANAFTRIGYAFDGWSYSADGEKNYTDGQNVKNLTTTDGDIVNLYARWKAIKYTVHFDANGGTGTMANQSFTYDVAQNLSANAFTRDGYSFMGWSTTENGAVAYTDGQNVKNLTATGGGTVNLYARWQSLLVDVPYIDENGVEQTCSDYCTILTGAETALGTANETSWYVVSSDISFDHQVKLSGDVRLILSDGMTMTMTQMDASKLCILGASGDNDLTIYGQSGGTGSLTLTNHNGSALGVYNLTINGGIITASAKNDALHTGNDLTINGGVVNATSTNQDGIHSESGDITINGGRVSASGGGTGIIAHKGITINGGSVSASGGTSYGISAYRITLGWTNATDRITANSYSAYIVVKYYQTFTDGTAIYTGRLTDSQRDAIAGKTLQPAVRLTLSEGITASGTGVIHWDNDIFAVPGTTVTLSGADQEFIYTVNGMPISGNTFVMPAEDVTVRAILHQPDIPYIDENGVGQTCCDYTILTGAETALGIDKETTWYVVSSDISFDHQVSLSGDVRLILSDSKTMTMTETDENRLCINQYSGLNALTIYGQSGGTGSLTLTNLNGSASGVNNLTINGGIITAIAKYVALSTRKDLTINGGVVNATSTNQCGISSPGSGDITINGGRVSASGEALGIDILEGNLTINGGSVSATGGSGDGICASLITLGWTNATDRITANSYYAYIDVKSGQTFTDGIATYTGSLTVSQREAIAGKTLRPYFDATTTLPLKLVKGTKDGVTVWWGTFYCGTRRYTLSEGAAAYTMDASRHLYRLGDDGRTIPADQAVIIIADHAGITLTPGTDGSSIVDHAPGGNILQGGDNDVQVSSGTVNSQTPCVLGIVNGALGFYPVANDYNGVIPANKAYYLQ